MKKMLLVAAIASCAIFANAQMKFDRAKLQKNFKKVEIASKVDYNTTRAMEVNNMYYYRPNGLFYSGWNRGYFNPGISFAPIDTEITFTADYQDGTPAWAYPSGFFNANGEPEAAEAQGDEISFSLPEGNYFTPILVNLDDQQGDRFAPTGYMEVGGQSRVEDTEYNGETVANDAYAVNYVPTGNIALIPNYLSTNNPDADARFGANIWHDDTYSTKGFGEFFTSPASFQVKGFNALVYASSNIEKDLNKIKASFVTFTGDQSNPIEEVVGYKDFDVELTEIEAPNQGYGIYHLLFQIKGDPITVEAGSNICPFFKSTKVELSPLFDGQPRWDETAERNIGVTTMMVACETADGEGYINVPSLALTNNDGNKLFLNSWCIGLDMDYSGKAFGGDTPATYDNSLLINDLSAITGTQVTLPIEMDNKDNITGLQFDLYLPDGITVAQDEDGFDMVEISNDRSSNKKHIVVSQIQDDGALRVLCYSNKNYLFSGNNGKILNIILNVSPSMYDGNYEMLMKNVILTTPLAERIECPNTKAIINVASYIPGDVNNDQMLDVSDISGIVSFILKTNCDNLVKLAADVNNDGYIDVSDISCLTNIIMNGNSPKNDVRNYAYATNNSENTSNLEILPFSLNAGEEKEIKVLMNNTGEEFCGLQFDLYLPEGMNIKQNKNGLIEAFLGSRTNAQRHDIRCKIQNDGAVRFLVYSGQNLNFTGEEGDVVTFTLCGNENIMNGTGNVKIKNIVLSRSDATACRPAGMDTSVLSISDVEMNESISYPADVYSVDGSLVKKNANNLDGLAKGVYIINNKKVIK